jgi:hypothetical protein
MRDEAIRTKRDAPARKRSMSVWVKDEMWNLFGARIPSVYFFRLGPDIPV